MNLNNSAAVNLPMVRIVFDDLQEFADLQLFANQLGLGPDWPKVMLLNYLASYKECSQVGDKPFSLSEESNVGV